VPKVFKESVELAGSKPWESLNRFVLTEIKFFSKNL